MHKFEKMLKIMGGKLSASFRDGGGATSGAATGSAALVASAIRRGAFFAVVMLSTLFASGAVYTIDYSVSGYNGSETLENFPVLVRLSANSPEGFDYNHCAANGADVYFTDASNNVLAHEIDTWDTSGESLIWVKIPSVTPVTPQSAATFTMHYGSAIPATITLPDAKSVWTAAGYSGVWHFGPAEGTDSAYDTRVSSTKGTVSYDGNDTYPGPLGGNLWTDVDSAVIYDYAANAPWRALGTGNTLTLTCWARTTAANNGRMLSTKSNWNNTEGFELTTQGAANKVTIGASGGTQLQTTINPALNAQWRLVTARYSGSEIRLFMDGADTGSSASATVSAPTRALTFLAGKSGTGEWWKGGIDEVRIRPAASSGDWIQAEYDSVASGTFLTGVVKLHTIYYKSGVFAEDLSNLVVVDSDGNTITLSSGDNVVFDDAVAGPNATVYFGETLPTGVTYSFSDTWTGTVLPQGVDTNTTYIWTGANGDGNMNTDDNWYGKEAPSTGAVVYIPAAKTVTIVNDIENFAPASITFGSGSGQVTINGNANENAIEGVAAITNLSLAVQTFNVPVSGTAIDFYNSSTHCAFRGGITLGSATFSGANTEAARALAGAWTFTGGDESYKWTPVENNRVMDNSSVTVEGELRDAVNLSIDAGCVVTAATLRATGNAKSAITKTNNGSLVVTGECRIDASADCYLASPADESKENSATVEFDSYIANNSGGWPRINAKDIIVGAGGISNLVANGVVVLAGSPVLHSRTGKFSIDQSFHTANSSNTTTIDTTQYGTEDVPAEVTINARFCKRTGSSTYSGGAMKVTGCGTLLFNSDSDFTGGLTVTDTATVAVNPGMKPGAGTVTVNNGATLQVAQSGTVALAGGLTLADGAALGFNFTEKDAPPVLNVTGKTVTLGENKNVTVKVSAADGIRPKGGSYVLTSGGNFTGATVSLASDAPNWAGIVSVNADGNIVLNVKPTGFMLIVK